MQVIQSYVNVNQTNTEVSKTMEALQNSSSEVRQGHLKLQSHETVSTQGKQIHSLQIKPV